MFFCCGIFSAARAVTSREVSSYRGKHRITQCLKDQEDLEDEFHDSAEEEDDVPRNSAASDGDVEQTED